MPILLPPIDLSLTTPTGTIIGTYDDQDRLIQYGSTTYSYSNNGELESETTDSQTTKYQYDVYGNLKSVTLNDGSKIEYLVDGQK